MMIHALLIDTWLIVRHPECSDEALAEASLAIVEETSAWPVSVQLMPHLEALYQAHVRGSDLSEERPSW